MDYKNDMNSDKFIAFLRETLERLTESHEKVAIVMDNASYHSVLVGIFQFSNPYFTWVGAEHSATYWIAICHISVQFENNV